MQTKPISILLIGIPGINRITQELSSGELTGILNELHEMAEGSSRFHKGTIIKFTGDVVSISFDTQDHELLAVESAIDLQEKLDNWNKTRHDSIHLSIKAAIASGESLIGELNADNALQQVVIGTALNHASRLIEFALEKQVLVSGSIFTAVKDHYEFLKQEPVPLRNSKKSMEIFELRGKKRTQGHTESFSERRISSEMVGRDKEISLLEMKIKGLIDGKGSVVNIIGKAGIGKSRLMVDMKVQTSINNTNFLEGRALSSGKSLSFHPIIHLIKSWAGITDDDLPGSSSDKLKQSIKRVAKLESKEIFPFIATMMGLPLYEEDQKRIRGIEGEALEKLILKNLGDLIILESHKKPLIIFIEDLHWADHSSVAFLESLYKLSARHPVMFINVFRPGYKTGDELLKFQEENLSPGPTNILINALTNQESDILIKNLLHNAYLPSDICQIITSKSEGNPFFIEEIVRSFIDEGIIEIKDDQFVVSPQIHEVNIPETINEVILSRVDKLDEKTKDLLKTASAIGRNFYYKILEEAADTIEELDSRLVYLKDVELINESGKKDEIEYLFKHALAQQATYDSIVKNTKKELHNKIARSIEKVFAKKIQEFYGTLVYHYEMAENQIMMKEYLGKAGEYALMTGAAHEAYHYLKRGLELHQRKGEFNKDRDQSAWYYYNLSLASHQCGLNTEAIKYIDKFKELFMSRMPSNKILLALSLMWSLIIFILAIRYPKFFFKRKPTDSDIQLIKLIIIQGESLVTVNPKEFIFKSMYFAPRLIKLDISQSTHGLGCFVEYSGIFIWTGMSFSNGKRIIDLAEKSITKNKDQTWIKLCYDKVMYRLFTGNFIPDEDEDQVFRNGMRSGALWETTIYNTFSAYIHLERGDWENYNSTRQRLISAPDILENEHSRVQYYRITGIATSKFRRIEDAIENSEKGIKVISETGHTTILMLVQCSRALALTLKGEFEEADYYIEESGKIIKDRKRGVIFYSTFLVTKVHLMLAKVTRKIEDGDTIQEWKSLLKTSKEAVKISRMFAGNLTEALRLRAIIFYLAGKHKKALKFFSESIDFGTESGSRIELSRAYFELGKFLADPKIRINSLDGISGNEYLEKASVMFGEMGLEWDLEQYRNYVSQSAKR